MGKPRIQMIIIHFLMEGKKKNLDPGSFQKNEKEKSTSCRIFVCVAEQEHNI